MSFWKSLGKAALDAGSSAIKATKENLDEIRNLKDEYEMYDDNKLLRLSQKNLKSKTAAFQVLKVRHGEEEAREMIKAANR